MIRTQEATGKTVDEARTNACALPARTADGKLHRQHGDSHDNKADKVKQDEIAAAVLTRYVRKAPDVSDADSAACADKQKSESGAE